MNNKSQAPIVDVSAIRDRCRRMLSTTSKSMISRSTISTTAAANQHAQQTFVDRIARPYRAGLGAETLTADQRDDQLGSASQKHKKSDILAETAAAVEDASDETGNTAKSRRAQEAAKVIEGQADAQDRKAMSRIIPKQFLKNQQQQQQAGIVRQRELEDASERHHHDQPAVPANSAAAAAAAATASRKLAADPRMALMANLGKKKKKK